MLNDVNIATSYAVPSGEAYIFYGTLIMHPQDFIVLRKRTALLDELINSLNMLHEQIWSIL